MTDYQKIAADNFQEVKKMLTDQTGWTKLYSENETEVFEKAVQGCSINCFKAVGLVNATPDKLIDYIWSGDEARWKTIDDTLVNWRIVERLDDNHLIIAQVNKLPWPLWPRDMAMVRAKFEENGTQYVTLRSVECPKVPLDTVNYVRANVLISAFIFEPVDGKSKVTRLILVDPAGNIPAAVVNTNAKGSNSVILWLRKNAV